MIRYDEFGDAIVAKLSGACFFTPIVAPRFLKQPGDLAAADKAEADDLPLIMDYRERIAAAANGVRIAGRITLADRAVTSPFANLAHAGVAIDRARWLRARRPPRTYQRDCDLRCLRSPHSQQPIDNVTQRLHVTRELHGVCDDTRYR